ncbi:hypothetical protein [Limnoglobus roseus]|uniref:Uncharacterized protein n=1 Tax=Limnoglobus roseus TaxID=2598579 RepID=A0A5C1ARJ0_9BACT|nr:hypothetical protein [Limnoglobus roseus]QEL19834.1 hypothetical protein PX52LOC_06915 [Limnoglobus roseus]
MLFTTPAHRVYQVADGRYCDPLAVRHRLLSQTRGELNSLLSAAQTADDAEAAAAMGTLAEAAREAFGFAAFDPSTGAGATETECLAELYRYLEWAA